jgi:T5SS/PEP-CTERM-associated repeat protein
MMAREHSISNGGAVSSSNGTIGSLSEGVGVATVDGAGSTWTNDDDLRVGYSGTGTLNITNGGLVTAGTTVSINSQSRLAIEVSNNSMFTVGTDFTNNGMVRLSAQAGLAAGVYTPITVGGTWGGVGAYEAFGGRWDNTAHTFTVTTDETGDGEETTIDLFNKYRVKVGNRMYVNFKSTGSSHSVGVKATSTSGAKLGNLKNLLGNGEGVHGSWDFDILNLPEGDSVLLSFQVLDGIDPAEFSVWHHDEGSGWTLYDASDLTVVDGWANFTVDSFSSYAVTAVPEPATMSLLALGGIAMLRRRKK